MEFSNRKVRNLEARMDVLDKKTKGHTHANLDKLESLASMDLVVADELNKFKEDIEQSLENLDDSKQIVDLFESKLKELQADIYRNMKASLEKLQAEMEVVPQHDTSNLEAKINKMNTVIHNKLESMDQILMDLANMSVTVSKLESLPKADVKKEIAECLGKLPDSRLTVNGEKVASIEIAPELLEESKIVGRKPIIVENKKYFELSIPEEYIEKYEDSIKLNIRQDTSKIDSKLEDVEDSIENLKKEVLKPKLASECQDLTSVGSGKIITNTERDKISSIDEVAHNLSDYKLEAEKKVSAVISDMNEKFLSVGRTIEANNTDVHKTLETKYYELQKEVKSMVASVGTELAELKTGISRNIQADTDLEFLKGSYTQNSNTIKKLITKVDAQDKDIRDLREALAKIILSNKQLQKMSVAPAVTTDLTNVNARIDSAHTRIDNLHNVVTEVKDSFKK